MHVSEMKSTQRDLIRLPSGIFFSQAPLSRPRSGQINLRLLAAASHRARSSAHVSAFAALSVVARASPLAHGEKSSEAKDTVRRESADSLTTSVRVCE